MDWFQQKHVFILPYNYCPIPSPQHMKQDVLSLRCPPAVTGCLPHQTDTSNSNKWLFRMFWQLKSFTQEMAGTGFPGLCLHVFDPRKSWLDWKRSAKWRPRGRVGLDKVFTLEQSDSASLGAALRAAHGFRCAQKGGAGDSKW